MSTIEDAVPQVRSLLENSYLVTGYSYQDEIDDGEDTPVFKLHLQCITLTDNENELCRVLRQIKTKVPRHYRINIQIHTGL